MIKLTAVCLGCNLLFAAFFLQIVPPVVRPPIISDALWSTIITVAGLVIVAWMNRRDNQKTKEAIKSEVVSVKSDVGEVKKEVTTLKENTDGKLTDLIDVSKQLSEKIGIEKGKEMSKAEHDEQSEKEKDANIAKGKIEGIAEAKADQTSLPASTEPVPVEVVNKENNPVDVSINEKKNKDPETIISNNKNTIMDIEKLKAEIEAWELQEPKTRDVVVINEETKLSILWGKVKKWVEMGYNLTREGTLAHRCLGAFIAAIEKLVAKEDEEK